MRLFINSLIILIVLVCSCNTSPNTLKSTSNKIDTGKTTNYDSSLAKKITLANSRFKIIDSKAIESIMQVKELNAIIHVKYQDPTIFNSIRIDSVPNEINEDWLLSIQQNQPNKKETVKLLSILINANTSDIRIREVLNDSVFPLHIWRNLNGGK